MFYFFNQINDLHIKKGYLVLTLIIFLGLAFTFGANTTDALSCSYTPIRQPPFDRYTCFDSGYCDTYAPGSGTACMGEWTNCTQYTNTVTGERWMTCNCSTSCQATGRTVSSSSCGSNNACSYSYGTICNGGNITGGNCIRVTPLDSNGNPFSGGPGDPLESVCNSEEFIYGAYGGTSFTTYVGDPTYLSYQYSTPAGAKNISTEVIGCPTGSSCGDITTEWVAPSDGTLIRGKTLTSTSTPPGVYNVVIKAYVAENPNCPKYANYTITVKPSRKMVCDSQWYDIPPDQIGFSVNSGPLALFNNGANNWDKYIKATYNGRYPTQPNQTTFANANFSTRCTYNNGIADTCTWDLPAVYPNTGVSGYPPVYGWSGPDGSGIFGTTTSVNDPQGRSIETRRVSSSGINKFQYRCSLPTTVSPVCDGAWRLLPQGGSSPAQPVGVYVPSSANSTYSDSVALSVRASGGTPSGLFVTSCRFNGTNSCTWDTSWESRAASTNMPPVLRASSTLSLVIRDVWGNWFETINRIGSNTSWNTWRNMGADTGVHNWGQPFRTQDKLGRFWQFSNAGGSVAYACGASQVCVPLVFSSARSSLSATSLNANQSFTVKCDYGVRGIQDALSVNSQGGATCSFANWDATVPTTANFNCTANNTGGTFPVACVNNTGTASNVCYQSNNIGNITVSNITATANIDANPLTIPYNTASTISWSSTNATSCTVSPTGWTGTSGSQSSGNLTTSRTYSLDCQPSGPNSSDSVTVTVQAPQNFSLNVVRSGQGTVTSVPSGINCGATCNANYVQDTSVTLTATPSSGRIFTGWGGACSGRGTCTVIMSTSRTVYANFAVDPNFKEF